MKTVLLVDDDAALRALLKRSLVAQGVDAYEAGTLHDAEIALRQASIDLVVTDGVLPDGPGVDFVERLRKERPALPIVFLTGLVKDLETFGRLTGELRVAQVFYKPVDPQDVARAVVTILQSAPAPEEDPFLAAELNRLKERFAAELPPRIRTLLQVIAEAQTDPSRTGEARLLAHKLRGSCGSYGFPDVGSAAGVLEDLLAFATPDVTLTPSYWEEVDRALCEMDLALTRECAAPAPVELLPPRRTLLIVNGDEELLRVAKGSSQASLLDVVAVNSSRDALAQAHSERLVGAIIDVPMNAQQAFDTARRIRESPGNNDTPLAFASVDQSLDVRLSAMEAGAMRFLQKPVSEERFAETIQQFLQATQGRKGRVLIVDDDPDVTSHYARHLKAAGMEVQTIPEADSLLDTLEQIRPDVLMLDVRLPRVSGIDVCRVLRMSERWELLPILIVTANTSAEVRVKAFRAGASDVITKPVLPEELLARLGTQMDRVRLLRDRSDRDPVSGLLLRRALLEATERALSACGRKKEPVAIVLMAIDSFREIAEQHGPLAGDEVASRLGRLLLRRYRTEDLRGRWSETEYILVAPGLGEDVAVQAAHRLQEHVSQWSFQSESLASFGVSLSAAVATFPHDGATLPELIRTADAVLRDGQRQSPNRVWLPIRP